VEDIEHEIHDARERRQIHLNVARASRMAQEGRARPRPLPCFVYFVFNALIIYDMREQQAPNGTGAIQLSTARSATSSVFYDFSRAAASSRNLARGRHRAGRMN
jgi:hypothetical protein